MASYDSVQHGLGKVIPLIVGVVLLVRIPYDRTADRVAALLAKKVETLPQFQHKSITWDQAMNGQARPFAIKTGIDIYFCDRIHLGSAAATKTQRPAPPILSPKAPTCPATAKSNSTPSPTASTTAPARLSAGANPLKCSTKLLFEADGALTT